MEIDSVAIVKNEIKEIQFIKKAGEIVSQIIFQKGYEEGLFKIEEQKYIDVIFYFHQSKEYNLITRIFNGETRGVFASRSPRRPNGLGVTTVKLLRREGNTLFVAGLDAIDGTPVIDIKPSDFSNLQGLNLMDDVPVSNPRLNIQKYISRGELKKLLLMAGQLHGHYCPGLSMGVMAAAYAMGRIRKNSDGMEDLLAIVENNNCFSDGVQYVTGCTFGNNALIFKDYGKNAFSLVTRDGKGVRIRGKNDILGYVNAEFPAFESLFRQVVINQNHDDDIKDKFKEASRKASFGMLNLQFEDLFEVSDVKIKLPPYAPIEESLVCDLCHESFMASRGKQENGRTVCLNCLNIHHGFLDGHGIHCP